MSQVYKTITYSYFANHRSDLVVIFPQAMQTLQESQALVNHLSSVADVLFIESGYYGITRINSLPEAQAYKLSSFVENFPGLLKKFPYRKLVFVSGSVGSLPSLSFMVTYPHQVSAAILTGPALYRSRGVMDYGIKLLLSLGIHTHPDRYFGLVVRLFKNYSRTPWLEKTYHKVVSSVGPLSYLLCLQEIMDFTPPRREKIAKLISQKTHILLGKNDDVFSWLCDQDLCFQAASCEWYDSDHSTLKSAGPWVLNLLKSSNKNP